MKTNKMMKKAAAWFRTQLRKAEQRHEERMCSNLINESRSRLQVREFEGKIYLCYDGMPLLTEEYLSESMPTALQGARLAYMRYVMRKQGHKPMGAEDKE